MVGRKAFLELIIDTKASHRLVIKLNYQDVPMTAVNFYAFCTAQNQLKLSYKNSRVLATKDFIEGCLTDKPDLSIFGSKFEDSSSSKPTHVTKGTLVMVCDSAGKIGSKFRIYSKDALLDDVKHVVFGSLLSGSDCFRSLVHCYEQGQSSYHDIEITDCGEEK